MRAKIRARQMRRVIPRTESTELDPESLHRAVSEAIAAGRLDGCED
ncbi:MAG TPA: hypothetical protein VFS20_32470 [Longimicrobium sp.]|nr:hypothetical protein [Longimicrobium sp.]